MMTQLQTNGPMEPPQPPVEDTSTPHAQHVATVAPDEPTSQSRSLAMVAHLSSLVAFAGVPSFIGPLVVWLLHRDRDGYAADAAREALNFNLSLLLYAALAVLGVIATIGLGLVIAVPAAIVAAGGWLVLTVIAAVRAADGEAYRYPLTLRLVQ